MNHTPRPWKWKEVPLPGLGDDRWCEVLNGGNGMAIVRHESSSKPTPWRISSADAHLIEAAPDLLAAVKWFFSMFDSGFLVRDITDDANPDYLLRMVKFTQELQTAMDAIAKAEGES